MKLRRCGNLRWVAMRRRNHKNVFLLRFGKILTPEAKLDIKSGEEAKIGIVRDGSSKENKHGGGNFPHSTRRPVLNSYN